MAERNDLTWQSSPDLTSFGNCEESGRVKNGIPLQRSHVSFRQLRTFTGDYGASNTSATSAFVALPAATPPSALRNRARTTAYVITTLRGWLPPHGDPDTDH